MPRNTGNATAGRAQLAKSTPRTGTRTRTTRTATKTQTADTEQVDRKAAKRGNFEPRSGLDPTIDASAGDKATEQQRELATA